MESLRVESLSKDFGGVPALQGVSFIAQVGECLVIIGPNGAGKSTLLNVLNGQLSPIAGRIYLYGKDITNLPTYRRVHLGQARSFQTTSLFLNLTVLDNVLLDLYGTHPSRYQMFRSFTANKHLLAKAQELLGSIALWERRDELVQTISYGEQRKLEVGLCLVSGAKLLLLDEPNCGLTPAESANIRDIIRNQGADVTSIVVAHDMDLVFGIADRIIVLHYGQIIANGRPEEIQADPRVKEVYMGIEDDGESA